MSDIIEMLVECRFGSSPNSCEFGRSATQLVFSPAC